MINFPNIGCKTIIAMKILVDLTPKENHKSKRKSQVFDVSIQNVQDSENYAIPNGRKGRVLIWLELSITIGK